MVLILAKKNFLNLKKNSFKKADLIVVPFSFEATTTYGKGTKRGPAAIIKASHQVELFDEELWQETFQKANIATLSETEPLTSLSLARKQIKSVINKILKNKKLPLILGGEHSITPFILEAYKENGYKDFTILQFDAHADLRDGYLRQRYSHAAAMRRCLDFLDINLVQIGTRSISNENDELIFWQRNQGRIKTFWAKDKARWKINEVLKSLKKDVYLTFDVDVFDPSFMPSTGTPEPGGLDWYEVLNILRFVCQRKKIIGADFVELSPIKNLTAPDFLLAKLIYRIIGYLLKQRGNFKK